MVEYGQGPRSGARDNGLRCAGYIAVGDLDPRIADSLLATLRNEGIAAYVTPTPASHGGYLDVHLPPALTNRLYADSEHVERAEALLAEEQKPPNRLVTAGSDDAPEAPPEIDFDAAWEQVLTSFQSTSSSGSRPWPASEEVERGAFATPVRGTLDEDPMLDEHFVPPPPPPLPRFRPTTVIGWLAIIVGALVLGTGIDGGSFFWLGMLSILAGGGVLVWHLKDGPPIDSGPDDGAVV